MTGHSSESGMINTYFYYEPVSWWEWLIKLGINNTITIYKIPKLTIKTSLSKVCLHTKDSIKNSIILPPSLKNWGMNLWFVLFQYFFLCPSFCPFRKYSFSLSFGRPLSIRGARNNYILILPQTYHHTNCQFQLFNFWRNTYKNAQTTLSYTLS